MVPRPDAYRPHWTRHDGTIDTDRYITFYAEYLDRATAHQVAGFVLEPIQGLAGDDLFQEDAFRRPNAFKLV
jgi:4-aminobutyrate aminotransferase-like enzyme